MERVILGALANHAGPRSPSLPIVGLDPTMDIADFLRKNFEFFQRPEHWYRKAVDLRNSASILFDAVRPNIEHYEAALSVAQNMLEFSSAETADVDCDAPNILPIYMLHGYALENILKAVIIYSKPELIASDKLSEVVTNHFLIDLAGIANIQLSSYENAVLKWLTEVVIWKGRYSIPKQPRHIGVFWAFDHLMSENMDACTGAINDVFCRAASVLPAVMTQKTKRYDKVVRINLLETDRSP